MTKEPSPKVLAAKQDLQNARLLQWEIAAAGKRLLGDEDIEELIDICARFPRGKDIAALEASTSSTTDAFERVLGYVSGLRNTGGLWSSQYEILDLILNFIKAEAVVRAEQSKGEEKKA